MHSMKFQWDLYFKDRNDSIQDAKEYFKLFFKEHRFIKTCDLLLELETALKYN